MSDQRNNVLSLPGDSMLSDAQIQAPKYHRSISNLERAGVCCWETTLSQMTGEKHVKGLLEKRIML